MINNDYEENRNDKMKKQKPVSLMKYSEDNEDIKDQYSKELKIKSLT